jgi:hypothetical protein
MAEKTIKIKPVGKRHSILVSDGVTEERICDVHAREDALLFMYFTYKMLNKEFDEEEFAEFIKKNAGKIPFVTIPTE